jgi:hypothetical protein
VKVLTLALGAVVATSAVVYLAAGDVKEEVDLVAPRPYPKAALEEQLKAPTPEEVAPANPSTRRLSSDAQTASDIGSESKGRDREAMAVKANLFRVLELPPPAVVVAPPPAVVAEPVPVVTPKPGFIFLGSFVEGSELQAIIQMGEKVEFVKPNQIVAGFRVDKVETTSISWTHEPTATNGRLQARISP